MSIIQEPAGVTWGTVEEAIGLKSGSDKLVEQARQEPSLASAADATERQVNRLSYRCR